MRDPNSIYDFYTGIGIAELHNRLLKGSVAVPGEPWFYIIMYGPLNETIELRQFQKDGKGVMLYKLTTNIRTYIYKQPTFVDYHNLFNVGDRATVYPPRETFIRRFILWNGGYMGSFESIISEIRNGNLNVAAAAYAHMVSIGLADAQKVVEKLRADMKTRNGSMKKIRTVVIK
jgi:hypothetical protein